MKKELPAAAAHVMALVTILIWGTSFIATKVLLKNYTPVQIMLARFALAYAALWLLRPKRMKVPFREECRFSLLVLTGCTLYFLAENNALRNTLASNVSILVASAPVFTAILAHFVIRSERLSRYTFIGFAVAITGVALVVFNGSFVLKLNPLGDLLSVGAALCWAVYSVLLRKSVDRRDPILLTRRLMLWGFITAFPAALLEGKSFSFAPLKEGRMLFCFLFLGVVCSAVCYVLWNTANRRLGTVVVGNYVYLNPLSTLITAGIVLKEPFSFMSVCGAILILLGIFAADKKAAQSKGELAHADTQSRTKR